MLNEELQTQQQIGLGTKNYSVPQSDVAAVDGDGYFGKPEFYDYSGVKLPENYCYDDDLLNEFNELAAKYNLSQKGANELMSMAVKLTELTGNNFFKTMAEQQRLKVEDYRRALVNDREIGGANFAQTMRTADVAYTQFANNEVQALLSETGLDCHPSIVKMFYNIGKRMQNDSIYKLNAAPIPKENREDILFPTML